MSGSSVLGATARPTKPPARWSGPRSADEAVLRELEESLRLPRLVCELLVARGIATADAGRTFLRPRLEQLHAPLTMRGMAAAVARLSAAIDAGEPILVHGDYDVDGMCSTTLLVRTVRELGGVAHPFIPHRVSDGYDLGDAGVRAAREVSAKVVVTCDCGTSAHAAVAALTSSGVDVIITDHHLPSVAPPECLAVLNPRVAGCDYPDKDLCAAGVVLKLALALLAERGASPNVALGQLDLVALATVADVAPLRGENRVIVRYGLRLMAETRNVGLRALIAAAGLEGKEITAGRIGFILAPRLNAVGRLGHAMRGVELLMAADAGTANGIARELEELNRTRQGMDRDTLDQARRMLDGQDLDDTRGIVLASERWHPGVIGIVASRLVEEFYRPVVLVAVEDGIGKGSGRSIPPFDLHGGLAACRDVLLRFGGHRAAAGLTIDATRIPELGERFNRVASERLSALDLVPELRVDAALPLSLATGDLETLLTHFEPFGIGNAAPVLASSGVRVTASPRTVGKDGLKLLFQQDGFTLDGIWWGGAPRAAEVSPGALVDVAYRLERDTYQGANRLVARVADVRRHA